jgi:hypothetical protein
LDIFAYFLFNRCDFNKYTLQYVAKLGEIKSKKKSENEQHVDIDNIQGKELHIFIRVRIGKEQLEIQLKQ